MVKIVKSLDFIGSSGECLFYIGILMIIGANLSKNNCLKIIIAIFYAGLPNRFPKRFNGRYGNCVEKMDNFRRGGWEF